MSKLSFAGHTVVVTGAGGGLGRAYALAFASRGANVVVNDFNQAAAQKVVDEIVQAGGKAAVNGASVTDGAAVIKTAIDVFGGITILINNAGILRDKAFKNMTDQDWDMIHAVHLKGSYSCSKAAWPHFRNQKFGRVINIASAAGIYGNFGQANYSAAKMGLVTFTKTLAYEGAKYGIRVSTVAPIAASPMLATVAPPEILEKLSPDYIAPFVLTLCHPDGPNATGRLFELGAGWIGELRWQRTIGALFKTDSSFTPSAVAARWSEVKDFSKSTFPVVPKDEEIPARIKAAQALPPNQQGPPVRFDGKTVIITGAGAGLGRAYALMYAGLGANVVVNDINGKAASSVVEEILRAGGKATAAVFSAEDGEAIVKKAMDTFGSIHVIVCNAGFLRDKSFVGMSDNDWDSVMAIHLRASFKLARAVWGIFMKQKFGRIILTSSQVGLYGNFGQANYSTAKGAILGLARTLALEGEKYNILTNAICPIAGTTMTATVWPKEMVEAVKPDYVAPVVGYLSSEENTDTNGLVFEINCGWAAQVRFQRTGGYAFRSQYTPEDVIAQWHNITNFDDGRATNPANSTESMQPLMDVVQNSEEETPKAKL